jgi:hypothetical protein
MNLLFIVIFILIVLVACLSRHGAIYTLGLIALVAMFAADINMRHASRGAHHSVLRGADRQCGEVGKCNKLCGDFPADAEPQDIYATMPDPHGIEDQSTSGKSLLDDILMQTNGIDVPVGQSRLPVGQSRLPVGQSRLPVDGVDLPLSSYGETYKIPDQTMTRWMENEKYSTCYKAPASENINCNSGAYLPFDEANSRLASMRARDKRAIDGWVSKSANYYKKNYSRELDEAENKRWWGNDEF